MINNCSKINNFLNDSKLIYIVYFKFYRMHDTEVFSYYISVADKKTNGIACFITFYEVVLKNSQRHEM